VPISIVEGQTNQGSATGVSSTLVTLPSGTTAGNTVLVFASASAAPSMSGFTSTGPGSLGGSPSLGCFRKPAVDGETSWTLSWGVSGTVAWFVCEVEGLDNNAAVDVSAPASFQNTGTGVTSIATGTTGTSTSYDGLAVAVFGAATTGTTPATFSGYTNGFTELVDQGSSAATSLALAVATLDVQQLSTWSSTATLSASSNAAAMIIVFNVVGSKKAADIVVFTGFEFGTLAGATTGLAGSLLFDTVTGSPTISGGELVLSAAAAAESVGWISASGALNPLTSNAVIIVRLSITTPASLPGADVDLLFLDSTADLTLWYRTATQTFGVKIGAGTEQASTITVAPATRYEIDLQFDCRTTAYTADWRIDGEAQPQATVTSTASWTAAIRVGRSVSVGAQFKFDNVVVSRTPGHYPLGDFDVVMLGPDPAGTPTVSGTAASFRRFISNGGTIDGSFVAADIRNAVDDWPPTIGASADGLAVVTAHATDYIEIPMATYDAAGVGSVRGVRPLLVMWAAAATAATCKVAGYDGITSATLFAEADPEADNSTTTPAWIAKMWKPAGGWTQAKLDAAAIRFGSNDATPDIGPHAVGMEVAIQNGETIPVFGGTDPLRVEQLTDPVTGGILALHTYTPAGQAATLTYEVDGTPVVANGGNPIPASSNPHIEVIDAPDLPTVGRIELAPAG
jgi:hypothetical protein